ncbi:MAG: hypothetical protein ACREDO_06530 [Methyloceanibacter sp.]
MVERLGDLGDTLAHEVVKAAGRQDRKDRVFGLLGLLLVGEGEQSFGGFENTGRRVLGGATDRRELTRSNPR